MTYQQIMNERRSVNFFDSSRAISDEQVKAIVDLAVLAPSAFNLQPWRIIAVKSQEAKEKLQPLAFNQPKISEAPVTLILVANREAYEASNPVWDHMKAAIGEDATKRAMESAGFLYGTSEERKIKFSESNTGILAMAIMAAAKEQGIDSHPMSGMDFGGIKAAFELKPQEDVVMLIALGYHDQSKELYPRGYRRDSAEIMEWV